MGVIKHYLTINGKSSEDFNMYISGEATFASPKRRFTTVPIPGRNGDLTIDDGSFDNQPMKYPAFITRDFQKQISDFEDFIGQLRGYNRLEDTYHPDEYRMAIFSDGVTPKTTAANLAGSFDLSFNCQPQRWLKSGEKVVTFTSNGVIKNPTLQDALPIIRIYGTGTVGVGDVTITVSACDEYVDLDCSTMDAYKGAVNCNANVSTSNHDVPTLSGETGIVLSGVTQVDITPRWWRA